MGIELPFGVMATLAQTAYPMELYDGIILKGPSTALIPTAYFPTSNASIQWHFVTTDADDLKLTMQSVANQVSTFFETIDFNLLSKARTFLGYCKSVTIHLGTKDVNYENIKKSDAKIERNGLEVSREISVSSGSSGAGFFGAMFSVKAVLPKSLRGITRSINMSLDDRLLRLKKQPLLLYDTESQRGWLVPELSVVLHIAHA